MTVEYPEDQFDAVDQGGPVGVHRRPRSPWGAVLPFLVVLLVVPLLAWGATVLIKGSGIADDYVESQQSQSPPAQSGQSESGEPEETGGTATPEVPEVDPNGGPTAAPDDPSATPAPPADGDTDVPVAPVDGEVNYSVAVAVLNGSGIQGLAGIGVEMLNNAGFTSAWGDNATDNVTPENTVYYRDAASLPTAQKVAEVLGISSLVESSAATTYSEVVVLLRTQF